MGEDCSICTTDPCCWKLPEHYNPNISINNYDADKTKKIYLNCLAIFKNYGFYVNKEDQLKGYSRRNIFRRIYYYFQGIFRKDSAKIRHQAVVSKIEKTFRYILKINTEDTIPGLDIDNGLSNLCFFYQDKFFCQYENLAKKAIRLYPKNRKTLHDLAYRILHERPFNLLVTGALNIQSNVAGTPRFQITLWKQA